MIYTDKLISISGKRFLMVSYQSKYICFFAGTRNIKIDILFPDNCSENFDAESPKLFEAEYIFPEFSPTYSHESNRVVELLNKPIITMTKGMLYNLHLLLWAKAVNSAV